MTFHRPQLRIVGALPARHDGLAIRQENLEERRRMLASGKLSFDQACRYLRKSREYADKANELFRRSSNISRGLT